MKGRGPLPITLYPVTLSRDVLSWGTVPIWSVMIDLKEMPGCMLWQEKLSSPLPLAPKETMVWAVPGFLRHTVRPPTQPPFPSGETVSSAFSPHTSSTEAVYPSPNPEGVRGDHLESVALLQNCMRNGPSEEGPDEPTVWVQVLPFGLPTS